MRVNQSPLEALLLGCQVLVPDFEIYISHANPNYKVFSSCNFVDDVVLFIANNNMKNIENNGRVYEEDITSKPLTLFMKRFFSILYRLTGVAT